MATRRPIILACMAVVVCSLGGIVAAQTPVLQRIDQDIQTARANVERLSLSQQVDRLAAKMPLVEERNARLKAIRAGLQEEARSIESDSATLERVRSDWLLRVLAGLAFFCAGGLISYFLFLGAVWRRRLGRH